MEEGCGGGAQWKRDASNATSGRRGRGGCCRTHQWTLCGARRAAAVVMEPALEIHGRRGGECDSSNSVFVTHFSDALGFARFGSRGRVSFGL